MSDNIVEIGNPARLSVKDSQLVIEREGFLPFVTPVSGVTALLLAHPQVTLTQAVFSRLAEAGAIVVTIDGKYRPAAMSLPLQANTLQSERIAAQAELSPVRRKRLWTQIVQAKIRAQASLLRELSGSDCGLAPCPAGSVPEIRITLRHRRLAAIGDCSSTTRASGVAPIRPWTVPIKTGIWITATPFCGLRLRGPFAPQVCIPRLDCATITAMTPSASPRT